MRTSRVRHKTNTTDNGLTIPNPILYACLMLKEKYKDTLSYLFDPYFICAMAKNGRTHGANPFRFIFRLDGRTDDI